MSQLFTIALCTLLCQYGVSGNNEFEKYFLFNVPRAPSMNITTYDIQGVGHSNTLTSGSLFDKCLGSGASIDSCSKTINESDPTDLLNKLCHVQNRLAATWSSNEEMGQEALITKLPFPVIGGDATSETMRLLVVADKGAEEISTNDDEFWSNIEIYTEYYTFELRKENIVYSTNNQILFMVDVPRTHVDLPLVFQATFGVKWSSLTVSLVVPYSKQFTWCGQIVPVTSLDPSTYDALSAYFQACRRRGRYLTDKFSKLDNCDAQSKMESWVQITPSSGKFKTIVYSNKCTCYYKYSVSPVPEIDPVPVITINGSDTGMPIYTVVNFFKEAHGDAMTPYPVLDECTLKHIGSEGSKNQDDCVVSFNQQQDMLQIMTSPKNISRIVSITVVQHNQQHRISYTGKGHGKLGAMRFGNHLTWREGRGMS